MVVYHDIDRNNIKLIEELWNQNKEYHIEIETYFKNKYECLNFKKRMEEIFCDDDRIIKITVAKIEETVVGYCISGIKENVGEIISIHVCRKNRKNNIGSELIKKHIEWMENKECKNIGVYVSSINTKTIEFYARNGFKNNLVYMEMRKENMI